MTGSRFSLLLTALLLVVACDGGDDGDSSSDAGTNADSTTAAMETGTPAGGAAYEDCVDSYLCADGLTCQRNYGGEGPTRWCAPSCDPAEGGADCPPNPDGSDAMVACTELDTDMPICNLDCFGDLSCPEGMTCRYNRCGWAFELP